MSSSIDKKYNTRLALAMAAAASATASSASTSSKKQKKQTTPVLKRHESSDDDASEAGTDEDDDEEEEEEEDASASETDEADTETDEDASEAGTDDEEDLTDEDASEAGTDASASEAETDEDEEYTPGDELDEKLSHKEYQKFLSELFPSNYIKGKAAAAAADVVAVTPRNHKKTCNDICPFAPKKPRRLRLNDEEDEEDEDNKKMKNFNISFIINDNHNDGYDDYLSPTEALYDEMYSDDEDEEEIKPSKRKKNEKQVQADVAAFTKMKEIFANLPAEDKENPTIKKMIEDINKKEKRYLKQEERQTKQKKIENTRKLKALLRERDVMNDLQYFNEKMSIAEQESALLQIEEIKKYNDITKPYRLTLLDAAIPAQYKAIAYRKISALRTMEPGSGDYYKMKNWVDTFMQIPFGAFKNLPITINDGVEKCHEFMDNAKQILDQAVYGLNDAKLQIMQMVGQWIVNPSAIGTAIAIKGPMGTGKTTLVKEGISKILGRDFVFIALGGATDSSFLEGHSYTYEGSTWGKIVDLLIKCKSMNPVIYFDELDKISDTPKGEEIAGILTHLTDTAQNNQFHDRYFSEIDFDLSRCLFIFSYNDESKVNKILLDRMYRIQTQGYNQEQKTTISNKYLVPKICEQVKFQPADIKISDATLHYIITNYTDKEDGVRTLKRCLEIIYTKLNLYRLMRPDTNIFESEMSIKVEFPMEVSPAIVDKLIKKNVDSGSWHNMYM